MAAAMHTAVKHLKTLNVFSGEKDDFQVWKTDVENHFALYADGAAVEMLRAARVAHEESEPPVALAATSVRMLQAVLLTKTDELNRAKTAGSMATPLLAWGQLVSQFQGTAGTRSWQVRSMLDNLEFSQYENSGAFMMAVRNCYAELALCGQAACEAAQVQATLQRLPPRYRALTNLIRQDMVLTPSMAALEQRLVTHDISHPFEAKGPKDLVAVATGQPRDRRRTNRRTRPLVCWNCNQPDHRRQDCPALRKRNSNAESAVIDFAGVVASCDASDDWLVDGGSCFTLTSDKSFFEVLEPVSPAWRDGLKGAFDGSVVHPQAEGDIVMEFTDQDGGTVRERVRALYVPSARLHILGGQQLRYDHGAISSNSGESPTLTFKSGQIVSLDKRNHVTVRVIAPATCASINLWHRRFGHQSNAMIRKAAKVSTGVKLERGDHSSDCSCEVCAITKSKRVPFPKKTDSGVPSKKSVVSVDCIGPITPVDLEGHRHAIVFIDCRTRYKTSFLMKSRDEAGDKISQFVRESPPFDILRSDRAPELNSAKVKTLLRDKNIARQFSVAYSPQQNGLVERHICHITDVTRSMLKDSALSAVFWGRAWLYATWIVNRSVCRGAGGATPYQMHCGDVPDLTFMKVFGCAAFVHVDKQFRGKLEDKAWAGVFVGMPDGSKGYVVYHPGDGQIYVRRDVVFHEDVPGGTLVDSVGEPDTDSSDLWSPQPVAAKLCVSPEIIPEDPGEIPISEPDVIEDSIPESLSSLGDVVALVASGDAPTTYQQAVSCPDAHLWDDAMMAELCSLRDMKTYEVVSIPTHKKKLTGCRWVFDIKRGPDGALVRYKARLVAQGFTQVYGEDYVETYAPVVMMSSFRVLVAISVARGYKMRQIDVKTAYLNAPLDEEIYMRLPPGFPKSLGGGDGKCLRLKKSLYGLRQSAKNWNTCLDSWMRSQGFVPTKFDHCVYTRISEKFLVVEIYVDDTTLFYECDLEARRFLLGFKRAFRTSCEGDIDFYLHINIRVSDGVCRVSQGTYIQSLLRLYGLENCRVRATPVTAVPISKIDCPLDGSEEQSTMRSVPYRSLIGSLLHLARMTRPDIAYAVGVLARVSRNPARVHWEAAKGVLRYLASSLDVGLTYKRGADLVLRAHADADWATDHDDRISTSGYICCLAGGPVTWQSSKQRGVALSSTEAEYLSAGAAGREIVALRGFLDELGVKQELPTVLYQDNQSCIAWMQGLGKQQRLKHLDVNAHKIREWVKDGSLVPEWLSTTEMKADFLTKPLGPTLFARARSRVLSE